MIQWDYIGGKDIVSDDSGIVSPNERKAITEWLTTPLIHSLTWNVSIHVGTGGYLYGVDTMENCGAIPPSGLIPLAPTFKVARYELIIYRCEYVHVTKYYRGARCKHHPMFNPHGRDALYIELLGPECTPNGMTIVGPPPPDVLSIVPPVVLGFREPRK